MSSNLAATSIEKANKEKEKGNEAFKKGNWAEAVGFYSAAMVADPSNSTFPLNRAMAWLKLHRYIDAEQDCDLALRLIGNGNQPASIKALYRRASARSANGKLEDALQDLEQVLKFDPKNVDAKREAEVVRKRKEKEKGTSTKTPLDLSTSTSSRPASDQGPSQASSSSSNSVEAARAFLAKVGMEDPLEAKGKEQTSSSSKSFKGSKSESKVEQIPPSLFPGEEGGFLRQASSRRLTKEESKSTLTSLSKEIKPQVAELKKEDSPFTSQNAIDPKEISLAPRSDPTTQAIEDFFLKPKPQKVRQINAFEFDRRWREVSSGIKGPKETVDCQIDFLSTIDFNFLAKSLGPLLEPDLLSSFIQCLNSSFNFSTAKSDPNHQSTLKISDSMVRNLPLCERFSMTIIFLDEKERNQIKELFAVLEGSGQFEGLEEVRRKWI